MTKTAVKRHRKTATKSAKVNEDQFEIQSNTEFLPNTGEETPVGPVPSSFDTPNNLGRSRPKPTHAAAKFYEEENEIQFEVEGDDLNNQFPSEGEVSDSDPESDVDVRSSQSVDEGRLACNDTLSEHFGPAVTIIGNDFSNEMISPICTNNNATCKTTLG